MRPAGRPACRRRPPAVSKKRKVWRQAPRGAERGCAPRDGDAVGKWLARRGQRLEQVQGYIPLPGTYAAALFACGADETGAEVYVPTPAERARQKRILTGGAAPVSGRRPPPGRQRVKRQTSVR